MPLFREYQRLLTLSNALDFDDLIAQTRTLLGYFEGIRLKWTESYSWVAVDEFQDTSPAEYQLFHLLTKDHRTISAFGDTDQWIYRWRGVDGRKIVDRFRADFPGHVELSLDRNFRSTRAILDAAAGVIAGGRGAPARSVSGGAERGEAVRVRGCPTEQDELDYIARRVGELGRSGLGWSSIAVLTRTNARAEQVARALTSAAIPSVTAGATEFFRRPEVKDLAAYPRLIANRYADLDLRRVADVPPRGLPESYLHEVARAGRARGLLLTDLVDDALLQDADPCGYEIDVAGRTHVALDVEATGLDVERDEIVEIAAFKVDGATGRRQDLRALIRPARSVGASRAVHGLSDAELAERGRDPISALAELRAFVGALPLVGHNITEYDLPLINANLRRVGLPVLANRTADTLWLARRALDLDRHDLDRVCARLGVPIRPSHRAADDAARAAACFQALTRLLTLSSERRRAIAARARPRFEPLARLIGRWRERAGSSLLSELITAVVVESGYADHLRRSGIDGRRRLDSLREPRTLASERFDRRDPEIALRSFLDYLTLARGADYFSREENRVLVLTIHAAKGLEFDAVLLAGAHDGGIPWYRNVNDDEDLAEERRLLYVGMTRARQSLELTYPLTHRDRAGRLISGGPSRFLRDGMVGTLLFE